MNSSTAITHSLVKLLSLCGVLALTTQAQALTLQEAKDQLPPAIKASATIRVATATKWAPFAYVDAGGQMTGIDIELMKLLGEKLGVAIVFSDMAFPSIIPGVTTGRFDVGINQIGLNDERKKVVDFVPYFRTQWSLLTQVGAAPLDINNLCGHSLALTQGSQQVPVVEGLSASCQAQSRGAIQQVFYPTSANSYMAVANGRAQGFLAAKAVAVYIASQNAKLNVAPGSLDNVSSVAGIAVNKQMPALGAALQTALDASIKDGSYTTLLGKYGVPESAYSAH